LLSFFIGCARSLNQLLNEWESKRARDCHARVASSDLKHRVRDAVSRLPF